MYPVMLDVKNRPCLVVGGGKVASRKVRGLLDEGAVVTVVAREVEPELRDLADRGRIALEVRDYRPSDVRGKVLVFVATNDRAVNAQVSEDSRRAGIWVNVADDPPFCTFHLPARVVRGQLQLALASNGGAPFVVRRLREFFDRRMGSVWAGWIGAAARLREMVLEQDIPSGERNHRFDAFFRATFDEDRFQVREPGARELERLARGELEEPGTGAGDDRRPGDGPSGTRELGAPAVTRDTTLSRARQRSAGVGFVSLVGAGPGDPELLTLKGRRRLEEADAIVYDRLAEPAMPGDLSRDVELFPVGKRPDHHPVPQEAIQALLVDLARRGKRVVRFKGGDPFVFGRGGEEAEALVEAGIPFEVIPAPTAGVAAAAYAGIPVTHREEAVRLTLLTAHESLKQKTQLRWDLIARDPHATLVGYMGVGNLASVVARLLENGLSPDTPSAMIERGTTPAQRTIRSPVKALPDAVARAGIRPPALFVIGSSVARADRLEWFETRRLHGRRVVAVVPADGVRAALEHEGAVVVPVSLPLSAAARVSLAALPVTDVLLRTREEAVALLDFFKTRQGPSGVVAWCSTPEALHHARDQEWRTIHPLEVSGGQEGPALRDALLKM